MEEVVIAGMSGKLPESDNLEEFWANLIGGVDMVTDDDRRWKPGEWAAGSGGPEGSQGGWLPEVPALWDGAEERPSGRALRRPPPAHVSRGPRAPGPLWGSRFDTVTPSRHFCGAALPGVWGVSQQGGLAAGRAESLQPGRWWPGGGGCAVGPLQVPSGVHPWKRGWGQSRPHAAERCPGGAALPALLGAA